MPALVPVEDVLSHATAQRGDRYVFGTEDSPLDPDPDEFDCSELVEWACARAGVKPTVPDGAYYQWRHTSDLSLDVDHGIATRGALLFAGTGRGVGRQAITHVAWSLGDGTTIEARGARWGVGTWAIRPGRFQFSALIPGVDYAPRTKETPDMTDEDRQALHRVELRTIDLQNQVNRLLNAVAGYDTDGQGRRMDGTNGTDKRLSYVGHIGVDGHGIKR